MFVSIIIPVQRINDYVFEACSKIQELEFKDFEVLIFADEVEKGSREVEKKLKVRIIPSSRASPAVKRDMAMEYAKGDIFAFIDDDAYPRKDWLKNALRHFHNPDVAAVGGPSVTPAHDSFWQRVSGAVFLSRMGGGHPERYWPVGGVREVDDWPSVNLLVRKDVFERIGGFNSAYWPGEDTKLCLDIIRMGKKILYDPEVLVWHHRRKGLLGHLRQIGGYGLHRGFFVKKFPETSRRLRYFLPSFFFIFMAAGIIMFFWENPFSQWIYYAGLATYFLGLFVAFFAIQSREKKISVSLISLVYIFLTHLWYGFRFLQGFLLTKDLRSKLKVGTE